MIASLDEEGVEALKALKKKLINAPFSTVIIGKRKDIKFDMLKTVNGSAAVGYYKRKRTVGMNSLSIDCVH